MSSYLQFFERLFAGVCLVCAYSAIAVAEDWPQWRGVNRDGIWETDDVVDDLPEGQIPIEWSIEIGPGYNGPTVADGRVFVMDRIADDRDRRAKQFERVLCVNSATGDLIWEHKYECTYTISYTAGPRASVTVDGSRVYSIGAMGNMYCLSAETGEVVWSRDLKSDYKIDMPIWGIAASPLIYEDLVIQQSAAGPDGACVIGFDKVTGEEVWRSLDEKCGYSSPILIEQAAQAIVVCWTGESLSGLLAESGEVVWRHAMPSVNMPIGIATPAVDGEQVFVSSFYDGSMMIRAPKDSLTSELVWQARGIDERQTGASQVTIGDQVVSDGGVFGLHAMIGTSIVAGDYIYAVDSYGEFRCLDAKDGRRIWEDLTAVPKLRWATIHMVRQQDRVWMFNDQGELLIANLSPHGLQIVDRADLIEPTLVQLNRRKGVCWSHPAFAEKSIFARNDNKLIRASLAK